jgi:prophage regulatory protein
MSKLIRLNAVMGLTGLARSSIYQFIADGTFPEQVKLGARAVAWDASEIQEWIVSRIAASRSHVSN